LRLAQYVQWLGDQSSLAWLSLASKLTAWLSLAF